MTIITFSGKAGSGKDTAAALLQEHLEQIGKTVTTVHYADPLKMICKTFFKWDGEKDEHGRRLLQVIGTDVIRNTYDEDFFVGFILEVINIFSHCWEYVLIPDARFENEIELMRNYFDTYAVNVKREFDSTLSDQNQAHVSENALDNYQKFDFVVENNGTLDDLRERMIDIASCI